MEDGRKKSKLAVTSGGRRIASELVRAVVSSSTITGVVATGLEVGDDLGRPENNHIIVFINSQGMSDNGL